MVARDEEPAGDSRREVLLAASPSPSCRLARLTGTRFPPSAPASAAAIVDVPSASTSALRERTSVLRISVNEWHAAPFHLGGTGSSRVRARWRSAAIGATRHAYRSRERPAHRRRGPVRYPPRRPSRTTTAEETGDSQAGAPRGRRSCSSAASRSSSGRSSRIVAACSCWSGGSPEKGGRRRHVHRCRNAARDRDHRPLDLAAVALVRQAAGSVPQGTDPRGDEHDVVRAQSLLGQSPGLSDGSPSDRARPTDRSGSTTSSTWGPISRVISRPVTRPSRRPRTLGATHENERGHDRRRPTPRRASG